jgi:alpha-beta hydrolase superfamily lysophospholipase
VLLAAALLSVATLLLELEARGVSFGFWAYFLALCLALRTLELAWLYANEGARMAQALSRSRLAARLQALRQDLAFSLASFLLGLAVLHQVTHWASKTTDPLPESIFVATWTSLAPVTLLALAAFALFRHRRAWPLPTALVLVLGPLAIAQSYFSLQIHRPRLVRQSTEQALPLQRFDWPTRSGARLAAFHYRHSDPNGLLVVIHGVGSDHSVAFPTWKPLQPRQYSLLTIDQRAHGMSSGHSCTLGLLESEDLVSIWPRVLELHHQTDGPLILCGLSMGAATAILAAPALAELDGIVLISPYAKMTSTAMHRLPNKLGWLVPALDTLRADVLICGRRLLALEPLQHASEEGVPVLLIHARDDNKTPFAGARALAHAFGPRVRFLQLDSGGHADLATTRREEFSKALQGFEKRLR